MPDTPVAILVGDVSYEFAQPQWLLITAGAIDAPMPVLRHVIAEQKVLIEQLRTDCKRLEDDLLKATDENLALRLKRGKGRKAP